MTSDFQMGEARQPQSPGELNPELAGDEQVEVVPLIYDGIVCPHCQEEFAQLRLVDEDAGVDVIRTAPTIDHIKAFVRQLEQAAGADSG